MPSSEQDDDGIDFSLRPYEEWSRYLFDSPLPFDHDTVESFVKRPEVLLEYFERVCQDLPATVARVGLERVDLGIWAALAFPYFLPDHLWKRHIPIEARIRCIRSMKVVFTDVVARVPPGVTMENCFEMWWDFICGGFASRHGPKGNAPFVATDPESRRIHDALLETLQEILAIEDGTCQYCALHGLGHLRHVGGPRIVQLYLDRHGNGLAPEYRAWIERCRDGTVM